MRVLILLIVPMIALAQSSSENFALSKSVLDAAGGRGSSENFSLVFSMGQPTPIGVQSSESFIVHAGFLTPTLGLSPLSPIQELVIKEATPDAVLYWEAIAGAGNYFIYRDTVIDFTPDAGNLIGTASGTTFTDSNVLAGPEVQQYYIVTSAP